eukprot:scaffold7895_cov150-Skeletonema_marinoi.AAC.1
MSVCPRTGWVSQLASRQNMLPAGRKPIFVSARRKKGFLPAGSIFWREASCDTHPVRGLSVRPSGKRNSSFWRGQPQTKLSPPPCHGDAHRLPSKGSKRRNLSDTSMEMEEESLADVR